MERLQNILAKRGIASRRHAAEIILSGRVTVDGSVMTEPGGRVESCSAIGVDGIVLTANREPARTILIYKPKGLICSADDSQGATVMDIIPNFPERLVPVGRLDKESEGLLLMSNDGVLINRLTHPRFGQSKRYEVTLAGRMTREKMDVLTGPMEIDGYAIRPVEISLLKEGRDNVHVLEFILHEGRNRQIRKMCRLAGFTVLELRRTAIGTLVDFSLQPGEWRDLLPDELKTFLREKTS